MVNKFKQSIDAFGGITEGIFINRDGDKNTKRAVLGLLHSIDGLVGDAKRGKMSAEQLGKIMMDMHGDIIDARKRSRALAEGYKILPPIPSKYKERRGLEGPFRLDSGKVVYYDPKEGKYYDPDTDMYLSNKEYEQHHRP